jgi:hypothetical protein
MRTPRPVKPKRSWTNLGFGFGKPPWPLENRPKGIQIRHRPLDGSQQNGLHKANLGAQGREVAGLCVKVRRLASSAAKLAPVVPPLLQRKVPDQSTDAGVLTEHLFLVSARTQSKDDATVAYHFVSEKTGSIDKRENSQSANLHGVKGSGLPGKKRMKRSIPVMSPTRRTEPDTLHPPSPSRA